MPAKEASDSPLVTYFKGIAMGAADIVPGVSGGTIALILGIYERLISSLHSLASRPVIDLLRTGRWRRALEEVNFTFLVLLAGGIFTSVLLLSRLLHALLESRPHLVYGFFFGLIAASVLLVFKRIRRPRPAVWLLFALGAVAAFLLVGLAPAETPTAIWFLFLSGAVAVSALILPGISGAFILVLLGKYQFVLDAITNFELILLIPVVLGAVVGLLSFARLLSWLFRHYNDATLAILCGIMLGSLRKVWPWQTTSGEYSINLPPPGLLTLDGGALWVLLLALAGAVLVTLLDRSEGHNASP